MKINEISELEKLQKEKIKNRTKKEIQSKIHEHNDVNSIIENIEIDFSDHEKYENLSCDILYEHLAIGKILAQLALNSFKKNYDQCEISFQKTNGHEIYRQYYETIKQKKVDENFLIDRISYYITVFSLLSFKEFNEKCRICESRLSKNKSKCSVCEGSFYNEVEIENTKRKSDEVTDLCSYCDNKLINGTCQICGGGSKCLKTNLQKTNKVEDRPVQMRTNSSKTSSKSKIKSNPSSSQWICNVCSYNTNNSSNINCEVCMSSKFAKINSCVFESLSEASNEKEMASVENVENTFIEHDANNADNKDKWTCIKCTFNNRISVDLCEICLAQNINKIGPINDNELPEETWYCKICGENNLFECYKCKNCRVPAEFFNKWRCGQCSYYNDKVAKHCAVCYIENPYLIKCNLCAKNLVNKKYDKICKKCRILAERCTNKETIDYQDNGKIQSKMSESEKVSDKRYQRRNKINANQTLTINVSQNTETKGQHSIVDRKINNEETGNSKKYNIINKTPSDTSKFYNSSPAGDENSGNPEENPIKLKKNVSQKSERKQIFSSIGGAPNYEKTDNLTIYKVDKTQSEISESNKSLSKGDQNSGKLNKNQIKSNEFNQQKPGTKRQTPPVVKAINKINSKPCKNCKSKVCTNNQHWCDKCEYSQWYCQNEACDGINFTNEYCKQCTARKGSDFSNCANFWVMKDCKEVQMWQCEFCLQFIAGTLMKCNKCRNYRNLPNYIKCKCNWNNLNIRKKCDKCNADLIKIIKL